MVVGLGIMESNRASLGSFSSQVFVENVLLPDVTASCELCVRDLRDV